MAASRSEVIQLESFDPTRLGAAIFDETNRVRRELHLRPFQHRPELDEAADLQASSNALNVMAGHGNMITGLATPLDRARRSGLAPGLVSENAALLPLLDFDLATGYRERTNEEGRVLLEGDNGQIISPHTYLSFARTIVRAWMNSPGHRANIVNPNYLFLGSSARPTKSVTGLDLIAGIQVFYTPAAR